MNLESVLNKWSVNILPDEYLFEKLLKDNKDKCFYIDRLPLNVTKENAYKYEQFELYYEKRNSKREFLLEEKRFIDFFTKIWLYNNLYIKNDKEDLNNYVINDRISKKNKKYLAEANNTVNMKEVRKKEELSFWVQLGLRTCGFPIFYFEDYELLATPTLSFNFLCYLNNLDKYETICDIAKSNNLFFRLA